MQSITLFSVVELVTLCRISLNVQGCGIVLTVLRIWFSRDSLNSECTLVPSTWALDCGFASVFSSLFGCILPEPRFRCSSASLDGLVVSLHSFTSFLIGDVPEETAHIILVTILAFYFVKRQQNLSLIKLHMSFGQINITCAMVRPWSIPQFVTTVHRQQSMCKQ